MFRPAWMSASTLSLATVAAGAALLGTRSFLRTPLLEEMPVTAIILAEHLLLALFAVPVLFARRRSLAQLSMRSWFVLVAIGWGASGAAALLFTYALEAGNPTTASLLQNSQPLFVVLLAMLLLKERLARIYWPCFAAFIFGAYLLSFGTMNPVWVLARGEIRAAAFALAAAALWASGTVLARLLLGEISYVTLTAARFLLALPFLAGVAAWQGTAGPTLSGLAGSPARLAATALVPGLIAVLLFYRGLQGTKASYAVLAELMSPAAALVGNWLVLSTTITSLQMIGGAVLVSTMIVLAWFPSGLALRPRRTAPSFSHAAVRVPVLPRPTGQAIER